MRLIINSSKLLTNNNKIRFSLPYPIEIHEFHLINASIPYSFYNITTSINTFLFNGVVKTIPAKQYNAIQLKIALQSLMSAGVTVTFDRQSLKFTFTSTAPFTFNALELGYILGFPNQTEMHSVDNALTSSYVVDLTNRIRNIYIKSNIPQNTFENEIQQNNILYRVPIMCRFGDIIYYQNNSDTQHIEISAPLNMIEIELTDSFGREINFNNSSYQLEFYIRSLQED